MEKDLSLGAAWMNGNILPILRNIRGALAPPAPLVPPPLPQ